jgi:tetratricopeptide (TPR) repeat protein
VEFDLAATTTRIEFGLALTAVRERAGLGVRDVADATGISLGTLGGYFAGTHLPAAKSSNLAEILRVCGISDPAELALWTEVLFRVRHRLAAQNTPALKQSGGSSEGRLGNEVGPSTPLARYVVSTRPPIERVAQEPRLYGRRALLDELGRILEQPSNRYRPQVNVLHGIGGCGKSAVALALARRALDQGVRTWWITADGPDSVAASMTALAVELGASREQLRLGSSPDIVWGLLNAYRRRWLLIIDDADDARRDLAATHRALTDGTGWIRPVQSRLGNVLVTTRDGSRGTWGTTPSPWLALHTVPTLEESDGSRLLRDLAGPLAGTHDTAVSLTRRLGGLALALRLAGSYLAESLRMPVLEGPGTPRTFEEYEHALDEHGHRRPPQGTDFDGGTGYRKARRHMDETWELSLDLLIARGVTLAPALLRLLSCFGPSPLPYELLHPETMAASPHFPGLTDRLLWDTVRALADLSLLDVRGDISGDVSRPRAADLIVLHPLVRDSCRNHDELRRHLANYLAVSTALLDRAASRLDPRNPDAWPHWRLIADHCQGPLGLIRQDSDASVTPAVILRPATLAARYLRASGNLAQAEAAYAALVDRARAAFGAENPDVLEVDHDLCRVWYALGRAAEAETGFRRVLDLRLRVLGPDHPDVLTTQHYLARTLRDAGQTEQATRLFEATLAVRLTVLGADHHDTLTSRNNLADLMRASGRPLEAESMLMEVLDVRVQTMGAEHPATLVARQYLAVARDSQGRHAEAVADLRELAALGSGVWGEDHPRTLLTRHYLAMALLHQHLIEEARSTLRDVLDRRRRVLGDSHAATVETEAQLSALGLEDPDLP